MLSLNGERRTLLHVICPTLAVPEVDDGSAAADYVATILETAGSQGAWKFPDIESNSCVIAHALQATAKKHKIKGDEKPSGEEQYPYIPLRARTVSCHLDVHPDAAGQALLPPV